MLSNALSRQFFYASMVASIVAATPVLAQTANLTVTATVSSSCSIVAATLAFGSYVSGQSGDLDTETTMTANNCPAGVVSISADGGQSGNTGDRFMANGSETLNYQLYRDVGRTVIWSAGADSIGAQVIQAGAPAEFPIYGRIPGGQIVSAGDYNDTVVVTVAF